MTAAPTPGAGTADLPSAVARLHHLATDSYVCNVSYADTARMRTVLDGLARVTRERDEARAELAGYDAEGLKWLNNEVGQLRRQRDAALAQTQTLTNLVNVYGELGEDTLTGWLVDAREALGVTDAQ